MIDIAQCGAFIATLRKEQTMTQKQLAEHIGVTDKAISRWETGKGLPDAASMLALSECFGITINELLCGQRAEVPPTKQETDHTMMGLLQMADREKSKGQRHLSACIAIVATMTILIFAVFGILIFNDINGNGYSASSLYYTIVAKRTAAHIENGRFKRAANHIGFIGQSRKEAEERWTQQMQDLFSDTVSITSLSIPWLKEDDQFIYDLAYLEVYDSVTADDFLFRISVNNQDGIAFGGVQYIGDLHRERGDLLAERIAATLSTYYPG